MTEAKKCDQCGKFAATPSGWLTVVGKVRVESRSTLPPERTDLCGIDCLTALAADAQAYEAEWREYQRVTVS